MRTTNWKAVQNTGKYLTKRKRKQERALSAQSSSKYVPKSVKVGEIGFYDSQAWRELRFEVLKRSDGCCCLCGRSKRKDGVVLHVDHIKPVSKFPDLALKIGNLQVLCADCNLGKVNRDQTDWR